MKTDVMEGKWRQMRGQMKEWWGKLTDDGFDIIAGKRAHRQAPGAVRLATLAKVDVDTNKGTVYMTGNVENATVKTRATEIARGVSGVRDVVNSLMIR